MSHRGVDTFVLSAMNCSPNLSCNASQAFGKNKRQSAENKALSEVKLNKILRYVMMSS